MSLIKYTPSSILSTMQEELNRLVGPESGFLTSPSCIPNQSGWSPRVDIQEQDEFFVLMADLPGVSPKDINITIEGDIVTIQGERNSSEHEQKGNYSRSERFYGCFSRQFNLPGIDKSAVKAKSRDGVLEVTLPKMESAKKEVRRIEIE